MLFASLMLTEAASASCDDRSSPSYDDISYIKFSEYSLVGQLHPWFTFEGTAYRQSDKPRVIATLNRRRATTFIGTYQALTPDQAFRSVVEVLRNLDFL
jgi:hypothetical protein